MNITNLVNYKIKKGLGNFLIKGFFFFTLLHILYAKLDLSPNFNNHNFFLRYAEGSQLLFFFKKRGLCQRAVFKNSDIDPRTPPTPALGNSVRLHSGCKL